MKKLLIVIMALTLTALFGCGGSAPADTGSDTAAGAGTGTGPTAGAGANAGTEVSALNIGGTEFTFDSTDFKPMFAPSDMPEGNQAFSIKLAYTGSGADDALSRIYDSGYILVNDEQTKIGVTTHNAEKSFVMLIASVPESVNLKSAKISVYYDGQILPAK